MIVGVLTTCHTQYTWDGRICVTLFNGTTLQVFVTYLTVAIYVLLNKKIHILLSQVYCVWQVVKIPTIISNNLSFTYTSDWCTACVNTTVTLLHVSALKGPSSGTTDIFRAQGQQNACTDVNIRLNSSV